MQILFINHHGGGFAAETEITDGLTVGQLFDERMRNDSPQDYLIRVNRQPAAVDQVLQAGDRVSFTPRKIEGASEGQCDRFEASLSLQLTLRS